MKQNSFKKFMVPQLIIKLRKRKQFWKWIPPNLMCIHNYFENLVKISILTQVTQK